MYGNNFADEQMKPVLPAVRIRELQWKIRLILTNRTLIAVAEGSMSVLWMLMTVISFHFKDSTQAFEQTAEDYILDGE
jgi:hypothetical protein